MKNQLEATWKVDYQLSLAYSEKRLPFTETAVIPVSRKSPTPSTGNTNLFKIHPIVTDVHHWDISWFNNYE